MRDIDFIDELMVELKEAAVAKQWLRLQDVERRIAEQVEMLSKQQPLSDEMLGMLNKLQYLYMKIFKSCEIEHQELAEKMEKLRRNRDGMAAYSCLDESD